MRTKDTNFFDLSKNLYSGMGGGVKWVKEISRIGWKLTSGR